MKLLNGKELADKIKDEIEEEVDAMWSKPCLAVIQVGDNPASSVYVRNKEKACKHCGIKSKIYKFKEIVSEDQLISFIHELNENWSVNGILVQLPLPSHIDEHKVIQSIAPEKDVDGFHPLNVANLWLKKECMLPCTPKGIIKLLDKANIDIAGKNAVVIGRSNIVGLPISKLLLDRNATVTITHSKTTNLKEVTSKADILIAAIGKARFVKEDMVKEGAVVIDVGVNRDENGKLCGDVDFDSVEPKVSVITKVPGGVGPMTICCLMENTIEAFKRKYK